MRRDLRPFTLFLVLAMVCLGCPQDTNDYRFTSADVDTGGGMYGAGGDGSAGMGDEADGDSRDAARDVVEPDVIHRDGALLYVLNQYRGLVLVDLEGLGVLGRVPLQGYPRDLYVDNGRAYVLVGYAREYAADGNTISYTVGTRLHVIDVSDPAAPSLLGSFELEGDLVDSRLVGDVLYAVSAEFTWQWAEGGGGVGGGGVTDGGGWMKEQSSGSWVTSVNVADPDNIHRVADLSFDGYGDVIHATSTALFVAAPDWYWGDTAYTRITYVDISDPDGAIRVRDDVDVKGRVGDRFKMDAYEGVLRVVSSGREDGHRRVYVTTVSLADPDALEILGRTSLDDAVDETLFATRFDGDRAYIVTYFVVDPLFVVDLSDPSAPAVTGELVVPGWSTHIEPRGDRLIALGVDDTNRGRRVSVSLFDVEDPANPSLVDRVSFGGDWSWSSAYSDVKAFTVLEDLLIVPFSGWTQDTGGYDRLQFVSYSADALNVRDYVDVEGMVVRSFGYGGDYYGLTTEQLVGIDGADLDELDVTDRLVLAEDLIDYLEIGPDLHAAIVRDNDEPAVRLRMVNAVGRTLGAVRVRAGYLVEAYVHGSNVVLVGTDYDRSGNYESYYIVAVVDCSDPAAPSVVKVLEIDVRPYYRYLYWGYDAMPMGKQMDFAPVPWWTIPQSDTTFLVGDVLALRCFSDTFDSVVGDERATEGLALVDLGDLTRVGRLGLGYSDIVSVDAAGGKLYVGTSRSAGADAWRPLRAYFLRQLDVAGPVTVGPVANVPGHFLAYDAAGGRLVLRDFQYQDPVGVRSLIRTASWDGSGAATTIDSVTLPANASQVLARGARIYFDGYDDGFRLGAVTVTPNGALSLGGTVLVTEEWAGLLEADANSAYLTVGGGAIARYGFAGGDPTLAQLVPVAGPPLKIRLGAEKAYAPLGYYGLAVMPR